jgi:hypothetical protein
VCFPQADTWLLFTQEKQYFSKYLTKSLAAQYDGLRLPAPQGD